MRLSCTKIAIARLVDSSSAPPPHGAERLGCESRWRRSLAISSGPIGASGAEPVSTSTRSASSCLNLDSSRAASRHRAAARPSARPTPSAPRARRRRCPPRQTPARGRRRRICAERRALLEDAERPVGEGLPRAFTACRTLLELGRRADAAIPPRRAAPPPPAHRTPSAGAARAARGAHRRHGCRGRRGSPRRKVEKPASLYRDPQEDLVVATRLNSSTRAWRSLASGTDRQPPIRGDRNRHAHACATAGEAQGVHAAARLLG